jgi:hypothetical protein
VATFAADGFGIDMPGVSSYGEFLSTSHPPVWGEYVPVFGPEGGTPSLCVFAKPNDNRGGYVRGQAWVLCSIRAPEGLTVEELNEAAQTLAELVRMRMPAEWLEQEK